MGRPSSKRRAVLAAMALCAISLTGCTQSGRCGEEITSAPRITVDVSAWVEAHPDTNVRVCAEQDCLTGYNVIAFTTRWPDTPAGDGDAIPITAEPVRGSTRVESFRESAHLTHDQCGQQGVWLRLDGKGRLSTMPAG